MNLQDRLKQIQSNMAAACRQYGRSTDAVQLIAVSKQRAISEIKQAILAGQRAFGENYVQEALAKIEALADYPLEWHFIGPIQANKTKLIAEHFAWVHSVCRLKIAKRLSEQRPPDMAPLNICIQVNIDDEANKSGVKVAEVLPLAQQLVQCPRLKLRGLMVIPAPRQEESAQRQVFQRVTQVLSHINAAGLSLDTLSMGMSADYRAAIAEGATLVRVGTAIFGQRKQTNE